jgi:hypothetical protein
MRFSARLTQNAAGRWQATCNHADLGRVEAAGNSRDEAIEKLRGELRYRLELCPCSGESYQHIEIEIVAS